MAWKCQKQVLETNGFFISFPQTMSIDKAGKILSRKIMSVFHGLIKQDSKNLVGSMTPTKFP